MLFERVACRIVNGIKNPHCAVRLNIADHFYSMLAHSLLSAFLHDGRRPRLNRYAVYLVQREQCRIKYMCKYKCACVSCLAVISV